MSLPDRVRELLVGYPSDLTDAELTELRAAAEADDRVAELMAGIDEIERGRATPPDWDSALPEPELSEVGRARLELSLIHI